MLLKVSLIYACRSHQIIFLLALNRRKTTARSSHKQEQWPEEDQASVKCTLTWEKNLALSGQKWTRELRLETLQRNKIIRSRINFKSSLNIHYEWAWHNQLDLVSDERLFVFSFSLVYASPPPKKLIFSAFESIMKGISQVVKRVTFRTHKNE